MDKENMTGNGPVSKDMDDGDAALELTRESNQSYHTLLPVHPSLPIGSSAHLFNATSSVGIHAEQFTDLNQSSLSLNTSADSGLFPSNQGYTNMPHAHGKASSLSMDVEIQSSSHNLCTENEGTNRRNLNLIHRHVSTESLTNPHHKEYGESLDENISRNKSHAKSVQMFFEDRNTMHKKHLPHHACVDNGKKYCLEIKDNSKIEFYSCGACNIYFNTVCELHQHLLTHQTSGSYTYNLDTKTAYPKYDVICRAVQTFDKGDVCELRGDDVTEKVGQDVKETDVNSDQEELRMISGSDDPPHITRMSKRLEQKWNRANNPEEFMLKEYESKYDNKKISSDCISQNLSLGTEVKKLKDIPTDAFLSSKQALDCEEKTMSSGNYDNDITIKNDKLLNETDGNSDDSDFERESTANNAKGSTEEGAGIETVNRYNCGDCSKSYKFESGLVQHRLKQHKERTDVIDSRFLNECRWCHETFKLRKTLLNHVKVCDKNDRFKCCICEMVFKSRSEKQQHLQTHENRSDLTCKECGKVMTSLLRMQAHMKLHHHPKTIQCEQCGKSFKYHHQLNKHMEYCNNERPVGCDKCEMRFNTVEALKHHYSVHSKEKPFICHYCGYAGKKLAYLRRHIRSHTGEKPFSCRTCGLPFSSFNGLNRHNKIHTNTKTCICQYCGKRFTNNWNLKTHLRQHTGDTPYTCSECGMSFKQNVLVKLHMKSHHPYVGGPVQDAKPLYGKHSEEG